MIDDNTIKEKYESMTDSELLIIAKESSSELTEQAFFLFKQELIRRNLDITIPGTQTEAESVGYEGNLSEIPFPESLLFYALEEKEEGRFDSEILGGLMEKGLDSESAQRLISRLEAQSKKLYLKADSDKLTAGFILISGIAITFLPLNLTTHRLVYIIAWSAIIIGAWMFVRALHFRKKYKNIIQNIESQKKMKN